MVALFLQQHYCGELGGKVQFQQFERRKSNGKLPLLCYVTVGMFARRGLSSTAKTLRSLVWVVRDSEY